MMIAIGLFLLAGLAEIGGRLSRMAVAEGIQTIVVRVGRRADFNHLRRHPGFSGISIVRARLCRVRGRIYYSGCALGWLVDKKTPDLYDWAGAVICLAGVSVMLWAPRG